MAFSQDWARPTKEQCGKRNSSLNVVEVPDWRWWRSSLTDLGQDEVPQPADTVHVVPVYVPRGEVWEMDLLGDKWPGGEEEIKRSSSEKKEGEKEVPRPLTPPPPPVGLGGVVLVGTPDGLQHPVRVNPPQLQGVVHPTRHYLLPQQVKVLPHT